MNSGTNEKQFLLIDTLVILYNGDPVRAVMGDGIIRCS